MKTKKFSVVFLWSVFLLLLVSCSNSQSNRDGSQRDVGDNPVVDDSGQTEDNSDQGENTITIEIGDGGSEGFAFTNQLYNTTKGIYYEENVEYASSVISDAFRPLGSFEDRAPFDIALDAYTNVLAILFEESGQFSDIQPFSFNLTESTGGGIYALSNDSSFSVSINCETDGYQSVDYSVGFFPHSESNRVTPKTVCQDILAYTGVLLRTQDIEHVRDILSEADTDTLYVESLDGRTAIIFNAMMLDTEREYWSISVTRTI